MLTRNESRVGFTLIELTVVLALISIMMAVAMPRLLPAIAFSRHEAEARHLASFGRSAIAYSALSRESITVIIDLDAQEYYATRYETKQKDESAQGGRKRTRLFDGDDAGQGEEDGSKTLVERIRDGDLDDAQRTELMREQFDRFVRVTLEARARNVKSDGFLGDIGPKFGKFSLDEGFDSDKEDREDAVLITYPTLSRAALPEGIRIAKVQIGKEGFSKGKAEVPVSPAGMGAPVYFMVVNDAGDVYTVVWDPITASGRAYEGEPRGT
ncbi:MAG TPA: type II secretion system protein [Candidatus Hydrogenedentes bacterium]|nr:type II secretion system protein [Candidatus Hydrogenedentota bacterium]